MSEVKRFEWTKYNEEETIKGFDAVITFFNIRKSYDEEWDEEHSEVLDLLTELHKGLVIHFNIKNKKK